MMKHPGLGWSIMDSDAALRTWMEHRGVGWSIADLDGASPTWMGHPRLGWGIADLDGASQTWMEHLGLRRSILDLKGASRTQLLAACASNNFFYNQPDRERDRKTDGVRQMEKDRWNQTRHR